MAIAEDHVSDIVREELEKSRLAREKMNERLKKQLGELQTLQNISGGEAVTQGDVDKGTVPLFNIGSEGATSIREELMGQSEEEIFGLVTKKHPAFSSCKGYATMKSIPKAPTSNDKAIEKLQEQVSNLGARVEQLTTENQRLSMECSILGKVLCSEKDDEDATFKHVLQSLHQKRQERFVKEAVCDGCFQKEPCWPCERCGREHYCSLLCQVQRLEEHSALCVAVSSGTQH